VDPLRASLRAGNETVNSPNSENLSVRSHKQKRVSNDRRAAKDAIEAPFGLLEPPRARKLWSWDAGVQGKYLIETEVITPGWDGQGIGAWASTEERGAICWIIKKWSTPDRSHTNHRSE
jgi:hypothetical protein